MSTTEEPIFCVRNVYCDYWLSDKIDEMDWKRTKISRQKNTKRKVPVIRIFGVTPAGQKCCLHVHGVFPYFMIKCPFSEVTDGRLRQLASSIDQAMNVARTNHFKTASGNNEGPAVFPSTEHVYNIEVVSAKSFYGYNNELQSFLKISFYNPSVMKRAAEFMRNGAVMNLVLQPYQLHVPYILQFFIDYNIYGMDLVYCKRVKFRCKSTANNDHLASSSERSSNEVSSSFSKKTWNTASLLSIPDMLLSDVAPISTCELELDCCAEDIVNVDGSVNKQNEALKNPGLRFIWRDELSRRRSDNRSSQDIIPPVDERPDGWDLTESEKYFFDLLEKKIEQLANHDVVSPEPSTSNAVDNMEEEETPVINEDSIHILSQRLDELDDNLVHLLDEMRYHRTSPDEQTNDQNINQNWLIDQTALDVSVDSVDDHQVSDTEEEQREQMDMTQSVQHWLVDSDSDENGEVAISQMDGTSNIQSSLSSHHKSHKHLLPFCRNKINRLSPKSSFPSSKSQKLSFCLPAAAPRETNTTDSTEKACSSETTCTDLAESRREANSVWDPGLPGPSFDRTEIEQNEVFDMSLLNRKQMIWITPELSPPGIGEIEWWLRNKNENERQESTTNRTISSFSDQSLSDNESPRIGAIKQRPFKRKYRKNLELGIKENKNEPLEEQNQSHSSLEEEKFVLRLENDEDSPDEDNERIKKLKEKIEPVKVQVFEAKPHVKGIGKRRESQLDVPTPENSFGFNITVSDMQGAQVLNEIVHITVMSLEVLIQTRNSLQPDPENDSIGALFYSFFVTGCENNLHSGIIAVYDQLVHTSFNSLSNCVVVKNEFELFETLVNIVQSRDPDILAGYDIQRLSWGYVLERAKFKEIELISQLSRIPGDSRDNKYSIDDHWWSLAEFNICGRIVLNLWRILRHEISLMSYSFENTVFNILKQRIPFYSFEQTTRWYNGMNKVDRLRAINYFSFRAETTLRLILHCDLLNRTSELARLYGIQFYDVLSRGSQFRVESMMLRMTREQRYVAVSPSVTQRNRMAAPQCIPLTMEPESKFYSDPVVVLDFQSLYPSMVIAYNYCYSTCMGKVDHFNQIPDIDFGCVGLHLELSTLNEMKDKIHISPAGVVFLKESVRRGIMPQMLEEILNTRIMVKQCMKEYKNNKSLYQILDARQLGLKLIANVTYGYTAANCSGRMPCVEVADSIVHKGRETLERAIKLVNDSKEWNGRVVYGDTDSMFIVLPGRTKRDAFEIGEAIAKAVTNDNPKPVKLKFEKVYYPCVLQTKKRYVGYSYESVDQQKPIFDAKGNETVRRDTCPAVAKTLTKSLRILFDTFGDVDLVKQYVTGQFSRILRDRVSMKEFIFAKEYRGRIGYKPGACVPALEIAKRRTAVDKNHEPRMKERVAYVITAGTPQSTLISCVREPNHLLWDPGLRINTSYYIQGQLIPALNRVFILMGYDVRCWYREMPKTTRPLYGRQLIDNEEQKSKCLGQRTLSHFFDASECFSCSQLTTTGFCVECRNDPFGTYTTVQEKATMLERRRFAAFRVCSACTGVKSSNEIYCTSIDCPMYFRRVEFNKDAKVVRKLENMLCEEFCS